MDHGRMGETGIRPPLIALAGLVVLVLIAAGVPLASLLYVGVLLLCPLLMTRMHGGHGRAHDDDAHGEEPRDSLEGPPARAGRPPPGRGRP